MTETKTKIKYKIEVPISHHILVERDEVLTDEKLWDSITEEELLESISLGQNEIWNFPIMYDLLWLKDNWELYNFTKFGTDKITIFKNGEEKE